MKSKILGLFGLSMFIVAILVASVSAEINFTSVTGDTQSIAQGNTATVSFKLVENNTAAASSIDFNVPITLTSGSNTFNSSSTVTGAITTLSQNGTSASMSLTFVVSSSQAAGTYTGTLAPSGTYTGGSFNTLPVSITVTSDTPTEIAVCSAVGNTGKLNVKDIDFKNNGMTHKDFGDDNEWFPLDDIEVDIKIENNGDVDVDDVEIEWGIYNIKSDEFVLELEDEKDFNLKDGDEEVVTVSFNIENDFDVDLEDLDDGDHYRFYVTATGTLDNETASSTCVTDFENAEIIIESSFVILDNIQLPEVVQCGGDVQVPADVWNIGDRDEDEVSVQVYDVGRQLGILETIEVGDIDAFDTDDLFFNLDVPSDAEEGVYSLVFSVLDDDRDVYENDFDDDPAEFTLALRVEGNCDGTTSTKQTLVSASLESGGEAGKELVVKATIVNTGSGSASYTINAAGFTGWASSANVAPDAFTITSGNSRDVLITLNVKGDASGEESFNVEVLSGNELVMIQPVSVLIESQGGFFTGGVIGSRNAYLGGFGLLNLVLIVAIVFVVIRLMRK